VVEVAVGRVVVTRLGVDLAEQAVQHGPPHRVRREVEGSRVGAAGGGQLALVVAGVAELRQQGVTAARLVADVVGGELEQA
jgi:hypothetical protein